VEVFFATPSYDKTVSVDYNRSMVTTAILLTKLGIQFHNNILAGHCYLGMARNALVRQFLDSDATDFFFIDADVGWDAKVIPRILSYEEEIVGGLIPKRDITSDSCFHQNALTGQIQHGLFETFELPTAFMRIKRSVFAKLKEPYFKAEHGPGEYGEDIYFCRRWCELGEKMWIDADITFTHRGSKAWEGNFYDHCVKTGLLRANGA